MNTFNSRVKNFIVNRGDIFYANLIGEGSVQSGRRPVIVISNDLNNKYSTNVQIIPLTSKAKKPLPTHVYIDSFNCGLSRNSIALCEQLTIISKSSLESKLGFLQKSVIEDIEKAICVQLGFAA